MVHGVVAFLYRRLYRVVHMPVDLGRIDFDLAGPPYCPAASAISHSRSGQSVEQLKSKLTQLRSTSR